MVILCSMSSVKKFMYSGGYWLTYWTKNMRIYALINRTIIQRRLFLNLLNNVWITFNSFSTFFYQHSISWSSNHFYSPYGVWWSSFECTITHTDTSMDRDNKTFHLHWIFSENKKKIDILQRNTISLWKKSHCSKKSSFE